MLRGTGRRGAAVVDEWIEFAHRPRWERELVERALALTKLVHADWRDFAKEFDAGALGTPQLFPLAVTGSIE